MNFKNIIPIKKHTHATTHTHTHLINTCSSKFGATVGFKKCLLKQKLLQKNQSI